ncbi:nucleotidyltransferase domain-containing protein [Trinickia sp. EG282A]|uniref:nucleotidyltransferase domain-containing protein n=1 Tax=Trinickia sp. EG282A TaxID=3237013 RepID=UPI0034D1DF8C
MLADFLLTPKQQRILGPLLLNPDRSFSLSELFELAEGGRSSTQAFLRTLCDARVIDVETDRKQRRYRINPGHPLYPELRRIAVKSFGVKEPLERALAPIRDKIVQAFIFGSIASGAATAASDVDVMVVGDVRTGRVQRELDVAGGELGREIHVSVYPKEEWDAKRATDPVLHSIDQGPKIPLDVSTPTHRQADEHA